MLANGPDDALRALQDSGHLTLKKNTVNVVGQQYQTLRRTCLLSMWNALGHVGSSAMWGKSAEGGFLL